MSTESWAGLDTAELLQLGINAGAAGDGGNALAYFKQAAARQDASAMAHFLLGAEYAQNKLYERAVDEMEAALALDPAMGLARFQLGLLLATMADPVRAAQVLQPLDELGEADPLFQFGRGLRHLLRDEFEPAAHCLRAGQRLNLANPALNANIGMILATMPAPAAAPDEAAPAQEEAESGWRHMLISTYTGHGQP